MPTTKEMTDYRDELDALAADIQTNLNTIASKNADQTAIEDELQTIKAALVAQIGTARSPVNSKLLYTNDEARKAELVKRENEDLDFQALKSARSVKVVEQNLLQSEVEYQRRKHKSLATLLLYFANNPV